MGPPGFDCFRPIDPPSSLVRIIFTYTIVSPPPETAGSFREPVSSFAENVGGAVGDVGLGRAALEPASGARQLQHEGVVGGVPLVEPGPEVGAGLVAGLAEVEADRLLAVRAPVPLPSDWVHLRAGGSPRAQ